MKKLLFLFFISCTTIQMWGQQKKFHYSKQINKYLKSKEHITSPPFMDSLDFSLLTQREKDSAWCHNNHRFNKSRGRECRSNIKKGIPDHLTEGDFEYHKTRGPADYSEMEYYLINGHRPPDSLLMTYWVRKNEKQRGKRNDIKRKKVSDRLETTF